ncbi:MAG: InlB B-repeat-containing protein, partial [Proteobacteria bacterium]|nr:InlB B-repeat-containing protein [Pseudomonadota bacterium]
QTVEIRCESNPCAAPRAHWGWVTMLAENSNEISNATEGPFAEISLVSLLDSATYDSNELPYTLAKQAASGSKIVLNSSLVADSDSEYTFDHFEADGQTITPDGDNKIVVPVENTQIELVFKSVITFDENTGSGTTMDNQNILLGESAALSKNTYTKTSKTFLGWATASDGEVVYDDEEVIEPEGNMTLYAVWSE